MKIYTRGGDRGETSLLRGGRVRKDDAWIEAYGTVDELNSAVGLVRAQWSGSEIDSQLERVQRDLFDLGAMLAATAADSRFAGPPPSRIVQLEEAIDRMEAILQPLTSFILPGGSVPAAQLHVARTICRRAEREIVGLPDSPTMQQAIAYLNRLSDYLFVAARFANRKLGVPDVLWTPES